MSKTTERVTRVIHQGLSKPWIAQVASDYPIGSIITWQKNRVLTAPERIWHTIEECTSEEAAEAHARCYRMCLPSHAPCRGACRTEED